MPSPATRPISPIMQPFAEPDQPGVELGDGVDLPGSPAAERAQVRQAAAFTRLAMVRAGIDDGLADTGADQIADRFASPEVREAANNLRVVADFDTLADANADPFEATAAAWRLAERHVREQGVAMRARRDIAASQATGDPAGLFARVLELQAQGADSDAVVSTLVDERWDRSLITPRALAEVDKSLERLEQFAQKGRTDAERAELATRTMRHYQALQTLKANLEAARAALPEGTSTGGRAPADAFSFVPVTEDVAARAFIAGLNQSQAVVEQGERSFAGEMLATTGRWASGASASLAMFFQAAADNPAGDLIGKAVTANPMFRMRDAAAGADVVAATLAAGNRPSPSVATGDYLDPQTGAVRWKTIASEGVSNALNLGSSIGAGLLATAVTANPVAGFAAGAAVGAGLDTGSVMRQAYAEELAAGSSPEDARAWSSTVGAVYAPMSLALEYIPIGEYLSKTPLADRAKAEFGQSVVRALAKRAGRAAAKESITEVAQEAWSDFSNWAVRNDPAFEDWERRYGRAAAWGAVLGGAAGAVSPGVDAQPAKPEAPNLTPWAIAPEGKDAAPAPKPVDAEGLARVVEAFAKDLGVEPAAVKIAQPDQLGAEQRRVVNIGRELGIDVVFADPGESAQANQNAAQAASSGRNVVLLDARENAPGAAMALLQHEAIHELRARLDRTGESAKFNGLVEAVKAADPAWYESITATVRKRSPDLTDAQVAEEAAAYTAEDAAGQIITGDYSPTQLAQMTAVAPNLMDRFVDAMQRTLVKLGIQPPGYGRAETKRTQARIARIAQALAEVRTMLRQTADTIPLVDGPLDPGPIPVEQTSEVADAGSVPLAGRELRPLDTVPNEYTEPVPLAEPMDQTIPVAPTSELPSPEGIPVESRPLGEVPVSDTSVVDSTPLRKVVREGRDKTYPIVFPQDEAARPSTGDPTPTPAAQEIPREDPGQQEGRQEEGRQEGRQGLLAVPPDERRARIAVARAVRRAQTPIPTTQIRRTLAAKYPGLDRAQLRVEGQTYGNRVPADGAETEAKRYQMFAAQARDQVGEWWGVAMQLGDEGKLPGKDAGGVVTVRADRLNPGDTFALGDRTAEVIDAGGQSVTIELRAPETSLPVAGTEMITRPGAVQTFVIPVGGSIVANAGSLTRPVTPAADPVPFSRRGVLQEARARAFKDMTQRSMQPGGGGVVGRPDLFNPGRTTPERAVIRAADQVAMDQRLIGRVRSDADMLREAEQMLGTDYAGTKARLEKKARDGQVFTDAEAAAYNRIVGDAAADFLKGGDLQTAAATFSTYLTRRMAGTEAGRALRALGKRADGTFDRAQLHKTALADVIANAVTDITDQIQANTDLLRDPSVSARRKAQITRENAGLEARGAKIMARIRANLSAYGINPEAITDEALADPRTAARIVRSISTAGSTKSDMAREYWYNSILSGERTHIANVVGNVAFSALEYAMLAPMEAVINNVAGRARVDAATFGDVQAFTRSLMPALAAAGRNAVMAFQTEMPVLAQEFGRPDTSPGGLLERRGPSIPGLAGRVIRTPSRLMLASDEFVRTMNAYLQAHARAYREARITDGLSGDAAWSRAAALLLDPTSEAWVAGMDKADLLSFQSPPDTITKGILSLRGKLGWFATPFIPFVLTPVNIFKAGVQGSAFQVGIMAGKAALPRVVRWYSGNEGWVYSRPEVYRDAAKLLSGLGTMAAVAALMGSDDDEFPTITGSTAWTDRRGAREAQARTAPAMSIRIGDRYYSYARIEPFATTLALTVDTLSAMADARRVGDRNAAWAALRGGLGSLARQTSDKTFLSGIADLTKLVEFSSGKQDVETAVATWASSFASSWVPKFITSKFQAADDTVRTFNVQRQDDRTIAATALDRALDRAFPFPATEPMPRVDVWGRPVSASSLGAGPVTDYVYRLLSPATVTRAPEGPEGALDRLLIRYNQSVPDEDRWFPQVPDRAVQRTVDGVRRTIRFNDREFQTFLTVSGQLAADTLSRTPMNFDAPTIDDIRTIQRTLESARREVADIIIARRPAETEE